MGMYCWDYARVPRNTILIAGSGRSGTTWLANLVNYRNDYRDIFEPFHARHVPPAKSFAYNVYLRPQDAHPELAATARLLLTGGFQNDWTNRNNRRRIAGKRLVKEIRIHHFLKWLAASLPEMPIVFVMRHPLAVVESRQALEWPARLELYLKRTELIDDYLAPFLVSIEQALSLSEQSFERNVLFWCIENYVPLQQFKAGEIHIAFYENLVTEPEAEARRLFAFLNKPFDTCALHALDAPSSQTRADSVIRQKGPKLERWRSIFSPGQIGWALDTLHRFGLDRIYTDALTPRIENANVLLPPVSRTSTAQSVQHRLA